MWGGDGRRRDKKPRGGIVPQLAPRNWLTLRSFPVGTGIFDRQRFACLRMTNHGSGIEPLLQNKEPGRAPRLSLRKGKRTGLKTRHYESQNKNLKASWTKRPGCARWMLPLTLSGTLRSFTGIPKLA